MATPAGASPPPRGGIVVGIDGSPGSLAALRWAIREAPTRGMTVHAVTAWEVPTESTFGDMATVGDFHPVIAAEQILVAALADAGAADTYVTVTTAPIEGHPAEVLMQQAEHADLLVVGSRGHGKVFGALLGSVSQYLAAHATCPVVVIKPLTDQHGRRFPCWTLTAPRRPSEIPYWHRNTIDRRGPMAEGMYPAATREVAAHRAELAPEINEAFENFSRAVFAEGALPEKTKQLIAVAVAHVTQCPYCITGHTKLARRKGAGPEEIMEAIWVAAEMRAGGAYAHSTLALHALGDGAGEPSGAPAAAQHPGHERRG